ncbi:arylsulfatase [Microbacterium oryzae]|uniref:arylsulfatase n=1 Tax=Microbacterium oryzae TaxID=743009 RepID=UPI0025B0F2DC|nr:arylsulfatase [Microbacterium oryzae]MDN3311607.1 arylsulfatase [Microbacterium oryzae]
MNRRRPNVVVLLADDLGFSDLGCYGSEIRTPHLDGLAAAGVRLRDFRNTPRCSPSRASLLTGLHPHQAGIGVLCNDTSEWGGYPGNLSDRALTLAEILSAAGYETAARGKWHLSSDATNPNGAWPTERGFDSFYGTLEGCASYFAPTTLTRGTENVEAETEDPDYFYTDAIAEEAVSFLRDRDSDRPFFLYVPFTAPHWPLHARPETIERYRDTYRRGWDALREERFARQQQLGVIAPDTELSPRDPSVMSWEDEPEKEWQVNRMSVYAAMVEEMDAAIGRILAEIDRQAERENTIVIFLSDNGASADPVPLIELEHFRQRTKILRQQTRDGRPVRIGNDPLVEPGGEDSYGSYGKAWANLSNTPFRRYKIWTHEGGVSTPFILSWPDGGLPVGEVVEGAFQLTDVVPTIVDAVEVPVPTERAGLPAHQPEGMSMLDALRGGTKTDHPLWWEHVGNAAYVSGRWKLVREHGFDWELYDIETDRAELRDLAEERPEVAERLVAEWETTADAVGVIPFTQILDIYRKQGKGWTYAIG